MAIGIVVIIVVVEWGKGVEERSYVGATD